MFHNTIKKLMSLPLIRYIIISIWVGIIDVVIVWILYRRINIDIVSANSVGVITGSVIHYFISSKTVFQAKHGLKGFIIYLGTFLLGLVMADWLIFIGEQYLFHPFGKDLRFLCSKGVSVFIPFFLLYYIRKILFHMLYSSQTISE